MKFIKLLLLVGLVMPIVTVHGQEQMIDSQGYSITSVLSNEVPNVDSESAYVEVNNNVPYFTIKDITANSAWLEFATLDDLDRVSLVNGVLNSTSIPALTEEVETDYQPTGWVDNSDVYVKGQLISHKLVGETVNELNLFTATQDMVENGIAPVVEEILHSIKAGNSVRYRASAYFTDNNLVLDGIILEAFSIEDNGDSVQINIFIPNIQEKVSINYANGEILREEIPYTAMNTSLIEPSGTYLFYSERSHGHIDVARENYQAQTNSNQSNVLQNLAQSVNQRYEGAQDVEEIAEEVTAYEIQGFYNDSSNNNQTDNNNTYYEAPTNQEPAYEEPVYEEPVYEEPVYQEPVYEEPAYVYYENCSAARAAGAAPVYRGQPGYGSHLDRDNDGIGCE